MKSPWSVTFASGDKVTLDRAEVVSVLITKGETVATREKLYCTVRLKDGHNYVWTDLPEVLERQKSEILQTESKTQENKMKSIMSDFSGFVKEHRSIIYWVAVLMLVDHFVFNGAFRSRLQGIVDGMVTKLESKTKEI